jgi:hypothetical protein
MSSKPTFPWSVFGAVVAITVAEHWIASMIYHLLKQGMVHGIAPTPVWFSCPVALVATGLTSVFGWAYWSLRHHNPRPRTLAGKSIRYGCLMLALFAALCVAIAGEEALAVGLNLGDRPSITLGLAMVLLAFGTWWYDRNKEEFQTVVSL